MARETDVSPEILRFTQDSIKNTFKKPYEYQRIDDAVDQIGNNQLSPAVLMPLHVVRHESDLWSLDNRRLWVLRKAGVPKVKVIFVRPTYNERSQKFFASLVSHPRLERHYSSANYFPKVRGGVRSVGIKRSERNGDDPLTRMPLYRTPVEGSNKTTAITPVPAIGTVRIELPVSSNHESASSLCFHEESQQIDRSNVCPENLRFTQDYIENRFDRPYDYRRIDDTVDQIRKKQLIPAVFMPLAVVDYRNVLWSLDNRRLWVLRKAGVPTVKVIIRVFMPNYSKRSKDFFSSLSDPLLERQYSSADYFPLVRGDCRFVGINPPASIPLQLNHSTTFAGVAQANKPPSSPPPQRTPLRDITVRSDVPQISPSPNAYHQRRNSFVPNENSCPGGKKGSDSLWGKILNVVNCVMEKGVGLFRFITSWAFDPCNEKVVRLGMNSLVVLGSCLVLRQAYYLGQGSVNRKLYSRETITASEGGENVLRAKNGGGPYIQNVLIRAENGGVQSSENVLRAENGSGFFENLNVFDGSHVNVFGTENGGGSSESVVSDQNNNNNGGAASGYLGIVAVKAVLGVEKMISHLLRKMFFFLRSVVWNCVDLSKGVVVGSGRKALGTCSVGLSECLSSLHFITGQAAVSFGRNGILVSEFCLEKIWELLRFIKSQAFGVPGQMVGRLVGKAQDALSFYMNEIKELLRKVVCSPQMALSFCLNKVKELAQAVISFCLNKIKEFLSLQGF